MAAVATQAPPEVTERYLRRDVDAGVIDIATAVRGQMAATAARFTGLTEVACELPADEMHGMLDELRTLVGLAGSGEHADTSQPVRYTITDVVFEGEGVFTKDGEASSNKFVATLEGSDGSRLRDVSIWRQKTDVPPMIGDVLDGGLRFVGEEAKAS